MRTMIESRRPAWDTNLEQMIKRFFLHKKHRDIAIILLLAILCYFPIFLHLTSRTIQIFDEARPACNAYEMAHDRNLIVTQYEGSPDMWYTKPPLMIWLQVICIKIFGLNELSIRLPAAIAALLTCALIFFFCFMYLQQMSLGVISVLVLITSEGYIKEHVARTGIAIHY